MNATQREIESILDSLMMEDMQDSSLVEKRAAWWVGLTESERTNLIAQTITRTPAEAYKKFKSQ